MSYIIFALTSEVEQSLGGPRGRAEENEGESGGDGKQNEDGGERHESGEADDNERERSVSSM